MHRRMLRLPMKRLAYAAAAVILLAVLLVLIAPALVDTPAVRAEIQRRLDEALHGQVTWEALEVALFPPRGELRQVRIEIPGRLSAEAAQVNVGLRFWPLLSGQLDIASVAVQRPRIRITGGRRQARRAARCDGAVSRRGRAGGERAEEVRPRDVAQPRPGEGRSRRQFRAARPARAGPY